MNVVLIGSGNVAHVLGKLVAASHKVLQVYSRKHKHASTLAALLESEAISDTSLITQSADLYIIAIADSALAGFCRQWKGAPGLVVHTAGTIPINILEPLGTRFGVLYPLQSLRKERTQYNALPLLVEANSMEDTQWLVDFAATLSANVHTSTSHQRAQLHLAAVLVNNFTNYLYAQAQAYCEAQNLDFSLLLPLIHETVDRLHHFPARSMQTGPAARGDLSTIQAHLQLLKEMPHLAQLYSFLTDSIISEKGKKQ